MATIQSEVSELVTERSELAVGTIYCYLDAEVTRWIARWILSGDRLVAAQALQLLMRLDRELTEARADWNQDRFRRVMRARRKAVSRVRRRWNGVNPALLLDLGNCAGAITPTWLVTSMDRERSAVLS